MTSSCETFTLSLSTESCELDSPSSQNRSKVRRITLRRPGQLESDTTSRNERESGETRPKPADSRIYTARLNSVTQSRFSYRHVLAASIKDSFNPLRLLFLVHYAHFLGHRHNRHIQHKQSVVKNKLHAGRRVILSQPPYRPNHS